MPTTAQAILDAQQKATDKQWLTREKEKHGIKDWFGLGAPHHTWQEVDRSEFFDAYKRIVHDKCVFCPEERFWTSNIEP